MELPNLEWLPGLSLPVLRGEPHACPYLPNRIAANLYALPFDVDSGRYRTLMDLGFRRSGQVFYRTACPACAECRPIRIPVAAFVAGRSQRRVTRRNQDVAVTCRAPDATDEQWDLFVRYQSAVHAGAMLGDRSDFARFLGASPIDTFAMEYRVADRLIGVGIVDVCPDALSSVYFYYDPDERDRSLGVWSGLCEIEECRRRGLAYWYLGYFIAAAPKMSYKARFRPYELLDPDGVWRPA